MSRFVPSGTHLFGSDVVMDRTLYPLGLFALFLLLLLQLNCASPRLLRVAVEDDGGKAVADATVMLHPAPGDRGGITRSTNRWGEADFRLPAEITSVEVSVAKGCHRGSRRTVPLEDPQFSDLQLTRFQITRFLPELRIEKRLEGCKEGWCRIVVSIRNLSKMQQPNLRIEEAIFPASVEIDVSSFSIPLQLANEGSQKHPKRYRLSLALLPPEGSFEFSFRFFPNLGTQANRATFETTVEAPCAARPFTKRISFPQEGSDPRP
ncbi:MAG: hypothetical protein D6812_10930 [Deltaproteobacteria bacterium]|nr:MAG: hypothetical protein D6812_10930 [Deltaproteobacteria bacterium]